MRFNDLLDDRNGFQFDGEQFGTVPEGIDAQLLWDLWDIVCKQGENFFSFGKPGIGIRQGPVQLEAHDFRDNGDGGRAGLSVFYHEKSLRMQMTSGGAYMLELQNGMSVIWDRRVTAEMAREFIRQIDEACSDFGELIDGVRAQSRKDFIFWRDWVFRGHRAVFAPNVPVVPKLWRAAYELDKAEGLV